MASIDAVSQLSQIFGLRPCDPGTLTVEFVFSAVLQLLDASLDDEGLLELTPEKNSRWPVRPQEMETDGDDLYNKKRTEHHDRLQNINTVIAIELIGQFLKNKVTSRLLYLARQTL